MFFYIKQKEWVKLYDTLAGNACNFSQQEFDKRGYLGFTVAVVRIKNGTVIGCPSTHIHAEPNLIEAIKLKNISFSKITDFMLWDAYNRCAIIPCEDCINNLIDLGLGQCRIWIEPECCFLLMNSRNVAQQGKESEFLIRNASVYPDVSNSSNKKSETKKDKQISSPVINKYKNIKNVIKELDEDEYEDEIFIKRLKSFKDKKTKLKKKKGWF